MEVLIKLLKGNWLNWICCFGSSVLVSTMLFIFEGVKIIVFGTLSGGEIARSQLGMEIQIYTYVILFIGILLITYTVSSYSRVRLRDYGMYMIFGAEKKDIIQTILIEYALICGIAWIL